MVKKEVSLTTWLYGKEDLSILKNLGQQESYRARIELLNENLYHCTYGDGRDYHRAKEVMEAMQWWRERHDEIYINDKM